MRDALTVRIVANQPGLQVDAGKARPLNREIRDFLFRQADLQSHRPKPRPAASEFLDARNFLAIDQPQRSESAERVIEVFDLLGDELELIRRQVFCNDAALAIENQATYRRHRFDADPIALGFLGKQLVIDDLQLNKPRDNDAEQHDGHNRAHDDPRQEQAALGMMVLDRRQQAHQLAARALYRIPDRNM